MSKNWFSVEEITDLINNTNINDKKITSKTTNRLLNKIANENPQDEFLKRKVDNTQSGKGRKRFLYNINYLQRIIDHYHSGFYFFNDDLKSNKIKKVLINVKKLNDNIIKPIDGLLNNFPQEKEALKNRMNKANSQINTIIQKEMHDYELKIQIIQRQLLLLRYKNEIINDILEIKNFNAEEKIKYIKIIQALRNYPIITEIRKEIKIKKAESNNWKNHFNA